MILSDNDIKQKMLWDGLVIEPLQPHSLQPASVELHLGNTIQELSTIQAFIDPQADNKGLFKEIELPPGGMALTPGEFVLAHTIETVKIPNGLVARVEGKSSLGRLGLAIHVTAGFIDPGFEGQITLELVNHTGNLILIRPGMKIAQLCLIATTSNSAGLYGDERYGSHYQGQTGATVGQPVL